MVTVTTVKLVICTLGVKTLHQDGGAFKVRLPFDYLQLAIKQTFDVGVYALPFLFKRQIVAIILILASHFLLEG